MASHELLRPVWKMECANCTFLGGHIDSEFVSDEETRLDFYFHKASQFTGGGVLFVRWGDEEEKEDTSPINTARGVFELASRMAQELGLVTGVKSPLVALGHWKRGEQTVIADPDDDRGLSYQP